jgi:Zn-dependent protease with chaperone function
MSANAVGAGPGQATGFEGLRYPLPEDETRILSCGSCAGKNRVLLGRALEQPDKLRCGRCQAPMFRPLPTEIATDGGPVPSLAGRYQHPLDQRSLAALEAVPGVAALVRKLVETTLERYDRIFHQSSFVRVGGGQLPGLLRLFERAASGLGLRELPELYVYAHSDVNAHTGGVERPYVALTSPLVDTMTEDELLAVMAHELAHIQSQHVLYKIAARLLTLATTELLGATLGIGNLLVLPLQLALLKWDRCSELTADRGMLLATRDPQLALRVLMKLACGSARLQGELSLVHFMEQALKARQAPEDSILDRLYTVLQTASRTHPFPLWRAAELWQWACRGEYLDLIQHTP